MAHVTCHIAYCAHNLGGTLCNAEVVEINQDSRFGSEKTDCSTFIPRDFSGALLSLDNINYAGLVEQAFSGMNLLSPRIHCVVNDCKWNSGSGVCQAEEIEIEGTSSLSSSETFCRTFCQQFAENSPIIGKRVDKERYQW